MNQKIVILIGFLPNPRMRKRIELEKTLGELHLICWNKGGNMLQLPEADGYTAHIVDVKANVNPSKRLLQFPAFIRKATRLLRQIQPRVIHVQAFDMLHIAYWYKQKYDQNVKIVYEIADLSPLIMEKQTDLVRWLIHAYVVRADRIYCRAIDLLVVTSEKYIDAYFQAFVPQDKVLYFPNVPDLACFGNYRSKDHTKAFTVGFIGAVRYRRQMRNLIEAAEACDMDLMIAGYENDPPEFEASCKAYPRGEWVGKFDFKSQIAALYGKCDVMYSVYDADIKNVRVALPNKLYEAVYCEMPLIVAKNTYLAQVVQEWGVGVAVDHRQPEELVEALKRLRDDEAFYRSLCENCRKHKAEIDLERYNEQLKQRLLPLLESGH